MCEHCGCRGVPPIAELMDEHYALLEDAHAIRRALAVGDRAGAMELVRRLAGHLEVHTRREEIGIFAAMREQGDFVDEVDLLEAEHRDLDGAIEDLDPESPEFDDRLAGLLRELSEHIDRENLGIFPVSVVSLGGRGWDLVEEARSALPTFMTGAPDTGPGASR
ncbi:MAG TPA: hemerythrin domain-containing protein [Nocardioides sp.]